MAPQTPGICFLVWKIMYKQKWKIRSYHKRAVWWVASCSGFFRHAQVSHQRHPQSLIFSLVLEPVFVNSASRSPSVSLIVTWISFPF